MPPKRKSAAQEAASKKKAKLSEDGAAQVKAILDDASAFPIPHSEKETRAILTELAQYARQLEEQLAASKPKPKSEDELAAEVDKLAASVRSGITKQMSWKPTCKTGSAKWVYDGVCADPELFGRLFNLDGPPTFKAKKFTTDAFHEAVGYFEGSVRYNSLHLRSDVNVRWPGDGTFKLSGSYGI